AAAAAELRMPAALRRLGGEELRKLVECFGNRVARRVLDQLVAADRRHRNGRREAACALDARSGHEDLFDLLRQRGLVHRSACTGTERRRYAQRQLANLRRHGFPLACSYPSVTARPAPCACA